MNKLPLDTQFYTLLPKDGSDPIHLNISALEKLLLDQPDLFTLVKGEITESQYKHFIEEQGVEDVGVNRINASIASVPGFAVSLPTTHELQIVDGYHRAVWRYRNGQKDFWAFVIPLEDAIKHAKMEFPSNEFRQYVEKMTADQTPTRKLYQELTGKGF